MSDTIKKIKGWVNEGYGHNTNITFITEKFPKVNRPMPALLLVSTGDKVPEVMTKADVNDLLVAARRVQTYFDNEVTGEYESAMRRQLRSAIEMFAKKYPTI